MKEEEGGADNGRRGSGGEAMTLQRFLEKCLAKRKKVLSAGLEELGFCVNSLPGGCRDNGSGV